MKVGNEGWFVFVERGKVSFCFYWHLLALSMFSKQTSNAESDSAVKTIFLLPTTSRGFP